MFPIEIKSKYQKIRLVKDKIGHLVLYLDGGIQFHEFDEYRYHEVFAYPSLIKQPENKQLDCLICGGGDGLLARELIKWPLVKSITNVELDEEVIELAMNVEELIKLNEDSFRNKKVNLIVGDAYNYIMTSEPNKFDLIFCDFSDPWTQPVNKLYSTEFYSKCSQVLKQNGIMTIQSNYSVGIFSSIYLTLKQSFKYVMPYRAQVLSMNTAGFNLVSNTKPTTCQKVPSYCKYIDDLIIPILFYLPKDEKQHLKDGVINTTKNFAIYKRSLVDNKFYHSLSS